MSTKEQLQQRRAGLTPAQREALARRLRGEAPAAASPAHAVIPRTGQEGPAPLSFGQQRLWLLDQLQPGDPAFNLAAAVRLTGTLDEAALSRGLDALVARHESLRTTFEQVAGEPLQRVLPAAPLPLERVDLGALPSTGREEALRQRMEAEAARPFELSRGPLLRATLFRLEERQSVLLLVMHHIVSDGWSMGVLVQETAALYRAFLAGQPSPLPPLALQSADFARWQRGPEHEAVLEAELAWWREKLSGLPPVLELPVDHPRPPVRTTRGGTVSRLLPRERVDALVALGRREGATLFMVLLGALQVVLHRYSGQRDIPVGTPIAGRTRQELEGLIGFFVNTLVLRGDVSGEPTFTQLLRRVREVALEGFAHQQLPFERLVEALRPVRDLHHTPLFQVFFALQNAPARAVALEGVSLEPLEVEAGHVQFDLTWLAVERAAGLQLTLHYNRDLFLPESATRMLEVLDAVLAAVAGEPERRVAELPLPREQERLLAQWNDTACPFPADTSPPTLIEAQAARTPEAVAVVFEGHSLTYRELERRVHALARRLRAEGVRPEVPVAVCLERALELPVAMLAVMKAGGVYVPVEPSSPRERLAYVLRDTGAPVLLTQAHLREQCARPGVRVLDMEEAAAAGPGEDGALAGGAGPDTLAYVIYTSGSSGQPKGVMVAHRELCNQLHWRNQRAALGPGDRVLACIPFTFDPSLWALLGPLLVGATVHITRPGGHQDSAYLLRTLVSERITHLDFALPALQALLLEPGVEEARGSVRHIFCGGEAMPAELPGRVRERLGAVALFNQYGPTEAVVDATSWPCPGEGPPRAVSIGRAIANKRVYVLDAHLRPLPLGAVGELYVGGGGLARGYLGQPGMTAERFLPEPFSGEPGARMYRTGDLARWRADGELEFLGRADGQVKVRGMRIEPGEVEAALRQHPAVVEAVVAPWDTERGRQLAAYVVPAARGVKAAELRRFLRERLPEAMVPASFTALPALPLNTNGKVDRRALPPPEWSRREVDADWVAPRTPLEEQVASVFREVLAVEAVGAREGFFDLGGHSLLAVKVAARLREVLRVELPLRVLFEHPTVEALAARITREGAARTALPPLPRVSREGPFPLAPAQERLWRLERAHPGTAAHTVPLAVRLRGALDVAALERSLQELVLRHEALRTTFTEQDGRGLQRVLPGARVALASTSLVELLASEREAAARALADTEARRPFDLSRDVLLRGTLVRLEAEEHLLLLTTHRLAYDGASLGVLLRELSGLYAAFASGLPSPLAPPAAQYAEFSAWQRERLEGEVAEARRAHLRELLDGLPEERVRPPEPPRPVERARGGSESLPLPAALAGSLRELARREGATLFMALLAAWQVVLREHGGRDDVVVGAPAANRGRPEFEGLVGRCVNMLVLRGRLSDGLRFRELLQQVRATTVAAFAHQDVPPEAVPVRAVFNLVTPLAERLSVAGLEVEAVPPPEETAPEFELTLYARERGEALELRCVYRADLFEPGTIRGLLERLRGLLEDVGREPERTLEELARARGTGPVRASPRPPAAGPVIILGAGLVGSLLSIFLARRGYTVDVYERHADPRDEAAAGRARPGNPSGKPAVNLTLCTRGLHALDAVGLGDAVRRAAVPAHGRVIHGADGTLAHQPYGNSGEALHSLLRSELNRLLVGFAEREPGVRLHFGKRCVGVDLAAPSVRVEDLATGEVSVHAAGCVLGADGAFSAVRTQMQRLNRFSFSQVYSPQGYRELWCPPSLARQRLAPEVLHLWPRGHSMLIGQPNLDGGFTLTLHMPFEGEEHSFASLDTEPALLEFFEEHFPDALPLLPRLVEDYFARPPTSLVTIRCSQWVHQGRVALIGDAAHAIVPFYGQGANAGFEDCLVLARCLEEHGGEWSAALRAYEQERRPNADAIAELSLEHMAELREKVGEPRFLLRKALERKINRLYPERFAPLYTLISFTTLPYVTARRLEAGQRSVVDRLMEVPDVERCWDGPQVEALIHELMRGHVPELAGDAWTSPARRAPVARARAATAD